MSAALGAALGGLAWAALATCLIGTAARVTGWLRTPQRLPIPLTPAPAGRAGALGRLALEVLAFRSLFRASRWTWLAGWTLHAAMALAIGGHVLYFAAPAQRTEPAAPALAAAVGAAMLAGAAGLWVRRVAVPRIRYVSTPSDHLYLALLAAVAASGLALGAADPALLAGLKGWVRGLAGGALPPFPADARALVHVGGVLALLAVFPFGKLLHAPGAVLSPTRAPDRSRARAR